MPRRQLIALFVCSLSMWTVAQGLLALLPVYATRLGADPGLTGGYLAIAFAGITLGTVATGWLSDRFQRRKLVLVIVAVVNGVATWLMGFASAFWQLVILTTVVWFFFGVGLTLISILAGMFAGESERGKIFGILATNTSLGALIGGVVSGPIADQLGYPTLFLIAGLCWATVPLSVLFLQDRTTPLTGRAAVPQPVKESALGINFNLLIAATTIGFGASFAAVLGRPLVMNQAGFNQADISGAVAMGGLVSLPFPFLVGWLSDRVGRYGLVALCFLISAAGLLMLAFAVQLWHYWIATILLSGVGVSLAIGPALVTDLVPSKVLGTALARYGAAPPVGAVIGFLSTGYAIEAFGMMPTLIGAALLTVGAVALLFQVRRRQGSLTTAGA
ncbi:MAG: MFS transporter [Anaerolineae bacterium]